MSVIISVLCMHYKVSKNDFTLWSLLELQTYEVSQGSYSRPIPNYGIDFWLAGKYFELPWKSGLAETRLDRPVPPPLF